MSPTEKQQFPHLLIISHAVIGKRMAGPGIRAWEMAQVLGKQQPVTLIAPQAIDLVSEQLNLGEYTWGDAASLQKWLQKADLILANGYLLQVFPELAQIQQPLILDLYDPTLLENLELLRNAPETERSASFEQDQALLARQLLAGDFFLCATERQRDLYIGALMAVGRLTPKLTDADPELRNLIDVVGFGLPAKPPVKQHSALREVIPALKKTDPLLLWTGGLWDWMDPLTLVQVMPQLLAVYPNLRLVFLAGQCPDSIHPMQMPHQTKAQAAALGLLDQNVFFYEEWIPYDQRADFLLEADLALSLHRNHLETRYAAVRSRILDHLWAGLPSIVSAGDAAATLLCEAQAGLIVPIGDQEILVKSILRLISDPQLRKAQTEAAKTLAASLTWEKVVKPLSDFCHQPSQKYTFSQQTQPKTSVVHSLNSSEREMPQSQSSRLKPAALLEATRNAAIAVQEQTWRLQEQPLPAPANLRNRVRQFLIDQIVRPFVVPLLEQQQTYNIAVLRSMYAINEIADQRQNAVEQQISYFQHNDRLINEQFAEFVEQLAGLEETDSQLLELIQDPNNDFSSFPPTETNEGKQRKDKKPQ